MVAGAMPPEHEVYYGFTRFAMELNELEPGMRELLPHTDTRLRYTPPYTSCISHISSSYHQPIKVPTAGAQAFLDYT
jgi:hypothetical protein